ncbi:MAG: hypothetical protein HY007_02785 [Candidatus Sungbacteria bacterium]|nr:hypothetical protein [Candidatus Sungbacteria bacterium]
MFPSVPEELRMRLNTSIGFMNDSLAPVTLTLIFDNIEQDTGVKFFLVGRDYPWHCTLQEGVAAEPDLFFDAEGVELVRRIEQVLSATTIVYSQLLIDCGNVLLNAAYVPDEIINARQQLSAYYEQRGIRPLPMEDILHCTLARIRTLPKRFRPKKYINHILEVREAILATPVDLNIKRLFCGTAYQLLTLSAR